MSPDQIKKQSIAAYSQWCVQWRDHATQHSKYDMKPMRNFANVGIGKAVLLVANGFSFEKEIETIKKYAHNVDIMCCDKTLGHLLDHGIAPTYVVVCDANVNYEKYMKPWENKLGSTILFQNVCANPKWAANGNWKDKYFFVNKDIMSYEKEFCELSGCQNILIAGTNVSNMMLVMLTQCDDGQRNNFFGYDKLILIGYDYSWAPEGKYYAFDESGGGKYNYMKHVQGLTTHGDYIYTSNNLAASASWLALYTRTFNLPVVQCSRPTIADLGQEPQPLEKHIKYRFHPEDRVAVIKALDRKRMIETELNSINDKIKAIGKNHYYSYLASI